MSYGPLSTFLHLQEDHKTLWTINTLPVLEFHRPDCVQAVFPWFLKNYAQWFPEPKLVWCFPNLCYKRAQQNRICSVQGTFQNIALLCFLIVQAWTNLCYENGNEIVSFATIFFLQQRIWLLFFPNFFQVCSTDCENLPASELILNLHLQVQGQTKPIFFPSFLPSSFPFFSLSFGDSTSYS